MLQVLACHTQCYLQLQCAMCLTGTTCSPPAATWVGSPSPPDNLSRTGSSSAQHSWPRAGVCTGSGIIPGLVQAFNQPCLEFQGSMHSAAAGSRLLVEACRKFPGRCCDTRFSD